MKQKVRIDAIFGTPVKDYFSYLDMTADYTQDELNTAYDKKLEHILTKVEDFDVQKRCMDNLNEAYSVLGAKGIIPLLYERQLQWQKENGVPGLDTNTRQQLFARTKSMDFAKASTGRYAALQGEKYRGLALDDFVLPNKYRPEDVQDTFTALAYDRFERGMSHSDFTQLRDLHEAQNLFMYQNEEPATFRAKTQVDITDDILPTYTKN